MQQSSMNESMSIPAGSGVSEVSFESPFGLWTVRRSPATSDLQSVVSEFWEASGHVSYAYEKILPRGFADFMLNFGRPQRVLASPEDRNPGTYRKAWISGLHNCPLYAAPDATSGVFPTHFVAVSLRPQAMRSIFGLDAVDASNCVIDAESLFGTAIETLRDRIWSASTTAERFRLFADFLRTVATKNSRSVPVSVLAAMDMTQRRNGDLRVESICQSLQVSRKHLNNLYRSTVGLSPKTYARLLRFVSLIDAIQDPGADWVRLATKRGFFDQSHLIRDFNAFAGESPGSLIRSFAPDGIGVNYESLP